MLIAFVYNAYCGPISRYDYFVQDGGIVVYMAYFLHIIVLISVCIALNW